MQCLLVLFLVLLCSGSLKAQKEASYWPLRNGKALDFSSGNPVPKDGCQFKDYFGSASISDTTGKLLFYTNGQTVWNANHQQMTNGNLHGNSFSTQPAVIVPVYKEEYFIFTPHSSSSMSLQNPQPAPYDTTLRYSIVDMKKNNGLGEVIQKDIPLLKPASNCVAAVKHANGIDTWVMTLTNKYKHGTEFDSFYVFLVTACGVTDTVVSNVNVYGSTIGSIKIKFSPDGRKLFAMLWDDQGITDYLFDFNSETGEVSNSMKLCTASYSRAASFTADSKYLYCYLNSQTQQVSRFDLSQADICSSKIDINYSNVDITIQCAIDGKLYACGNTDAEDARIDFIKNASTPISDSIKIDNVFNGKMIYTYGFPNFIESYFDPNYHTPPAPTFTSQRACEGKEVQFTLNTNRFSLALKNVQWDFGDGTTSLLLSPSVSTDTIQHIYTKAGTYKVKFFLYFVCMKDSIVRDITIDSIPHIDLGSDRKICNGTANELSVPKGYSAYLWNTGSTVNTISVDKEGIYTIAVTNACNTTYDTIRFTKQDIWISNLVTPNNDEKNETLVVSGLDGKHGSLFVYDRWGAKIYENENYNNEWNANYKEGIYYYDFKLETCPNVNGWVQVLK